MHTNGFQKAFWTGQRALTLMVICLMAGIAGGWLIRGARSAKAQSASAAIASVPATTASSTSQPPAPAPLKTMADNQAAPLMQKLKSDPNNADLLATIGNTYYDAQQYSVSIDYYRQALQARPADAAIRTDMATAYWYLGNADTALTEFDKALTYAPDSPNTLFNRGLVKWQGKHDSAGAMSDWKKLLAANPNYEARDKVQQMLSEVEKQTGKSGTR